LSFTKRYIFSILYLLICILSLVTDWYIMLCAALVTILLVQILDKLGKGVVLREIIAFHGCFVTLVMPAIGYRKFTYSHSLARLWVRYMPVSESVYFDFALPAVSLFVFAICLPIHKKGISDEGEFLNKLIRSAKETLKQKSLRRRGLNLVLVGVAMFFIARVMPAQFRFTSLLFYFSAFAGILYVYYSSAFKFKTVFLLLFLAFIVAQALSSGMFTILAYMGMTIFSLLFVGRKMQFWKKASIFIAGVFVLLLIQSVKPAYRKHTWGGSYEGNKAALFFNLVVDKVTKANFLSDEEIFWIYYRTNQGFNIGLVMRRVPRLQPHDGGVNLLRSAAASVVPRVLWPDKPEAGGKFNMKYYTGITLVGWSTNIGPLGEAYGSFGKTGGITYMFFLGLFIRWAYRRVFYIARNIPLLICWLPVLFYQVTYSAETDTLQILNSLVKSAFFIWLLYKIVPGLFNKQKVISKREKTAQVTNILHTVS
jgi:hypothetical protein